MEVVREGSTEIGYYCYPTCSTTQPLFPPNPYSGRPIRLSTKARTWPYDATIDTIADLPHWIRSSCPSNGIINGGIRLDDFERDPGGGRLPAPTPPTRPGHDLFSWHAGIVYKPIPIASFYAAYATSESPIGSELDSTGAQYNGISATLVNVPPQEARSMEVGTKWELFDRRLLATAALFQTDVDNARTKTT